MRFFGNIKFETPEKAPHLVVVAAKEDPKRAVVLQVAPHGTFAINQVIRGSGHNLLETLWNPTKRKLFDAPPE